MRRLVYVAWSASNRSPMIRIPASRGLSTRVEVRSPDPAANPYLALAVMLKAGLDGIRNKIPLPAPTDRNIYVMTEEERIDEGIPSLPDDLKEALTELLRNEVICDALGDHALAHFYELKEIEWDMYRTQVHEWETRPVPDAVLILKYNEKAMKAAQCRFMAFFVCAIFLKKLPAQARTGARGYIPAYALNSLMDVAEDADDLAEDRHMLQAKRFHRLVLRLQANVILLFIETLHGRFIVVRHRHDNVAVVRRLLLADDDIIAVVNARVDHAVADDAEHEHRMVADKMARQRKVILDILGCRDRHARRDVADERHAGYGDGRGAVVAGRPVGNLDRARLGRVPPDQAFLLQTLKMAMDGRAGGEAYRFADLRERRGDILCL